MSLFQFDREIALETGLLLCGTDEAGRGPLAGPVFAAAVILPENCSILGLNDSKKLTEKKRDLLFGEITQKALAYGVASATAGEIDEINILNAAMLAMRRAVAALAVSPGMILVDGNADPGFGLPTKPVIKGDGKSACVAAASILAKVSRDRYMRRLHETYPQYRFDKHKGYGTGLHYEALHTYGPCPEHRESFLKKWRASLSLAAR